MSKHVEGHDCPSCREKTATCEAGISDWFWSKVKPRFLDCHISCGYRGQADQEQAMYDGKSLLHFPKSAHNRTNEAGKPASRALDLFQLTAGHAVFDHDYFEAIADQVKAENDPVRCGIDFRSLGDSDHFETA